MELNPKEVFYYFEEISKIPRGSGNTKAVSDYCRDFAKERGFYVRQDAWNNVVIRKEASMGREEEPGIILQGHLDMVAEKLPESSHDFLKDPIELVVDGEYLRAKDTTLGGDDGIAVAMALAILDDEELSHPVLEAIFTIDEETGMDGAKQISLEDVKGSYLLNIDSESEGIFTAGCAGGAKLKMELPVLRRNCKGVGVTIRLTGLAGGHSGVEIDKGRGNAIKLLAEFLWELGKEEKFTLAELSGGGKDNAIPRLADATIILTLQDSETIRRQYDRIRQKAEAFQEMVRTCYPEEDAKAELLVSVAEPDREGAYLVREYPVLEEESFKRIMQYIGLVKNGVLAMDQNIKGLVETSANLGIVSVKERKAEFVSSVRSSVERRKQEVVESIRMLAELMGGSLEVTGEYPAWAYKKYSHLREVMLATYRNMYGQDAVVDVIHAGLECGYLGEKKELDMVSFGPWIYDIHTTEERLSIPSTERVYRFVQELIRKGIR